MFSIKRLAIVAGLVVSLLQGETSATSCDLESQLAKDECYMKIALDFAKAHNPGFPFGALIVDHKKNEISCYGANSNKQNKLMHGETAAFWNCTQMYPSPTNDDMNDPGLDWSQQTLYTTGEPCPMCASQSIYRGVSRVVWGTSIPDINKSGRQQIMIRMEEVVNSARLGGNRPDKRVPELVGGVLKKECDAAFWDAFAVFRDDDYVEGMKLWGESEYIHSHEPQSSSPGEAEFYARDEL
ncbi:cytidine deaminase-like protein [Basidiobolus meristosporus CBS 931.73]|uniref:Cytidine deaminase-like protein n=1 Tax=Basidiobolus meristosporus CBS 931.73 TaxID=1314790 RepID=A0A1Y1X4W8_9FUNG|nr:cytidine deaminase-like protein [Basidiobolus meristosporus CBS 931.73]|eukprot:ORX80857.1 cytidine deaminase-like protein [Basidiobolus meristosporus CBS 931.73]